MIAAFLLACFGILVPMAAAPLRICLLEERLLVAEAATDANCCSDCDRETDKQAPCCLDLEALPDTSAPPQSIELPPLIISELPDSLLPGPSLLSLFNRIESRFAPIRGPTSPAAYRAVLGIWRL